MVVKLNDMNSERFEELAMMYGGQILRWPSDIQASADAFRAANPHAANILAEAAELDAALAELQTPEPSDALMARILGDASDVAAERKASEPAPRRATPKRRWSIFEAIGGFLPAAGLAASLALGFGTGMSGGLTAIDGSSDLVASVFSDDVDELGSIFEDEEIFL